jgi:hypothetical protein
MFRKNRRAAIATTLLSVGGTTVLVMSTCVGEALAHAATVGEKLAILKESSARGTTRLLDKHSNEPVVLVMEKEFADCSSSSCK